MLVNICVKLREDSLNNFQVIERTGICDRWTDRQMDRQMPGWKTICLPTLMGGGGET